MCFVLLVLGRTSTTVEILQRPLRTANLHPAYFKPITTFLQAPHGNHFPPHRGENVPLVLCCSCTVSPQRRQHRCLRSRRACLGKRGACEGVAGLQGPQSRGHTWTWPGRCRVKCPKSPRSRISQPQAFFQSVSDRSCSGSIPHKEGIRET